MKTSRSIMAVPRSSAKVGSQGTDRDQEEGQLPRRALPPDRAQAGAKKAIVAVAAAMLRAIHYMLRDGAPYRERGAEHFTAIEREQVTKRVPKQLEQLGVRRRGEGRRLTGSGPCRFRVPVRPRTVPPGPGAPFLIEIRPRGPTRRAAARARARARRADPRGRDRTARGARGSSGPTAPARRRR